MIIIKNIILYFIQIRHTDDFPSTGTRLVIYKMDSKIGFEFNLIVVEAIRGLCASFTVLTATVSEIFGGQTTPSILVV